MRIRFEIEAPSLNIGQKYKNLVCYFKGHSFEPYEDYYGDYSYIQMYTKYLFDSREVDKECSRCGKRTYKPKKKEEPVTVKWKRYSPLKGVVKPTKKSKGEAKSGK